MSEHTPGPWHWGSRLMGADGSYLWYMEDYGNGTRDDEKESADARLIVEAPAMAELLQRLATAHELIVQDEYSGTSYLDEMLEPVNAARALLQRIGTPDPTDQEASDK